MDVADLWHGKDHPRRVVVDRGYVGDKEGWAFSVYFVDLVTLKYRPYANVRSALYKTKREATAKAKEYLKTGHLDTYGSAE